MCGIFGYVGKREATPILISGLETLEYRGYDSAGIYVAGEKGATRTQAEKAVGAVANLRAKISLEQTGNSGIAHTRWATHGVPSIENAHPHSDCNENVWLAHNGIIENYKELKAGLLERGHTFKSETDSEVLAHDLEEEYKKDHNKEKAILRTLAKVRGTYGLAILFTDEPGKLFAARLGSPIVIGVGEGEEFISSDSSALLTHTKDVVYLEDGEVASLSPDGYKIFSHDAREKSRTPDRITWNVDEMKKEGYAHFMEKEIMEGPHVLRESARGRLRVKEGHAKLGGLEPVREKLLAAKRIVIVGCGSAYYAGLVGKYMLEGYAGVPTQVELASEFRYGSVALEPGTVLLAISQSGETADTRACIKEAKARGALTLGIVNAVGSTIARETDAGVYNHAGPEIGVASTKAFISQVEVLALLTLFLGRARHLSEETGKQMAEEIALLPTKVVNILERRSELAEVAKKYSRFENFLFIGRKFSLPIALEGALKLKEVSYVHAEGYGAGEMKHGPIAMIDENFPTVAIAPLDSVYEKTVSNIEEIRARRGPVFAIGTEGDEKLKDIADDIFYIPKTLELLSPILSVIPLQLFAYYIGTHRGLNVDRPRNLAKSVTVE